MSILDLRDLPGSHPEHTAQKKRRSPTGRHYENNPLQREKFLAYHKAYYWYHKKKINRRKGMSDRRKQEAEQC